MKAFLQWEILQKAWHKQLLEPIFKAACEEGIILKCRDGVTRWVFPKINIYSADLQEKWVSLCTSNFDNDNNSLVDLIWVDTPPAVLNAPAAWWKKKILQTLARPLTRQNANVPSELTLKRCRRQFSKLERGFLNRADLSNLQNLFGTFYNPLVVLPHWLVVSTVPLANTSISTVTILIYVWFFHLWRLPSDFCHRSDAWNGAWSHQKHRNVHLQDHLAFWHCWYDGWTVSEISSYGTPDTEWWNI